MGFALVLLGVLRRKFAVSQAPRDGDRLWS